MSRFILCKNREYDVCEKKVGGTPMLINIDNIINIQKTGYGARIYMKDDYDVAITCNWDDLVQRIGGEDVAL